MFSDSAETTEWNLFGHEMSSKFLNDPTKCKLLVLYVADFASFLKENPESCVSRFPFKDFHCLFLNCELLVVCGHKQG